MKNTSSTMTALALLFALAACGLDAQGKYERAQGAFAENEFRAARVDLISALREDPENVGIIELLARSQVALGDGEGAAATLERLTPEQAAAAGIRELLAETDVLRGRFGQALARMEGFDTPAADRVRALAHIGLDQPEEAEAAFKAGVERDDTYAPLLASYSRFEFGQGRIERARELADAAKTADPSLVDAHLVAGRIASAQNRLVDALAEYDAALELHRSNFDATLGKAAVLGELERHDEAAQLVNALADEVPGDTRVIFLQARLAAARGEWGEVRRLLQASEIALRDSPGMQMIYGEALLRLGQEEQALSRFKPLARRYPNSRRLRGLLAETQLALGDAEASLESIRPLAIRPDATTAELTLAARAAKTTGSAAAEGYSERARQPSPEWLGGELAKADQALRNGQWSAAEQSYENILARGAKPNAMVLNNLAYAKSQLGQRRLALELALRAVALEPDHASILDTAGWLLIQDGQKARGRAMLEKAARIEPTNTAIARRLAQATRD